MHGCCTQPILALPAVQLLPGLQARSFRKALLAQYWMENPRPSCTSTLCSLLQAKFALLLALLWWSKAAPASYVQGAPGRRLALHLAPAGQPWRVDALPS